MFLKLIFPQNFHKFISSNLIYSKKSVAYWLLLALVIRFFLMAFTIHPDFFFIHMFPNLIVSHGVINVYKLFENYLYAENSIYYSPPVMYFFSAVQFIASPINIGFSELMDKAYTIDTTYVNTDPIIYFQPLARSVYLNFFLMKFPYLLFEVTLLAILLRLSKKWQEAKKIFFISLFNPVVLYGTYMFGQFDIIPTTLLMVGLYLILSGKSAFGMLVIGIAATFKNFALILILPLALAVGDNLREKLKLALYGFLPFAISYLIVLAQAPSQAIYMIIPKYYIEKVQINPSVYSTIAKLVRYTILVLNYGIILTLANFLKIDKYTKILGLSTITLLALFAMSPVVLFHYFTIVIPLLLLFFIEKKWFVAVFSIFVISIAIFKNWTRIQQLGLLAPISSRFFTQVPATSEIIDKVFPYAYISSAFYWIFFLISIFLILTSYKKIIFQAQHK